MLEADLLSRPALDLLDDTTFLGLLSTARAGGIRFLLAGIPCETYSVARWRRAIDSTAYPLRSRYPPSSVLGLPGLGEADRDKVSRANLLAERACLLCQEVHDAGGYT